MGGTRGTEQHRYRRLATAGGRWLAVAALGGLGALGATALAARGGHARAHAAAFGLSASPTKQSVPAGAAARYRISISRRGFRGHIDLSLSGTPREAYPQLGPGGSQRVLTIVTSGRIATGRYRLVVRAQGGGATRTVQLLLTIQPAKPAPIGISGSVGELQPGTPRPLNVTLSNPNPEYLWVTALTVAPKSVSAPRSTALLPCPLADFSIQQFSGVYPLVLPPSSTRTLSALQVAPAQWPQALLLDRPANQDGCQGATVALSYSARGTTL